MSTAHNALNQCTAIVVGYEGECANLIALARKVGFGAIQELNQSPDLKRPEYAVAFFLVNHRLSDETKGTLVRRLRRSPAMKVRFAPMIAIGPDVDFEVVLKHVALGFDDFITLPDKTAVVQSRLISQIDTPQTYVETATYFGPDRRRMEQAGEVRENRKAHAHSHTRMTIQRDVEQGIRIVRQQIFV